MARHRNIVNLALWLAIAALALALALVGTPAARVPSVGPMPAAAHADYGADPRGDVVAPLVAGGATHTR